MSSLENRMESVEAALVDTNRHVAIVGRDVAALATLTSRSFDNVNHQCDRIELDLGRTKLETARHTVQFDQFQIKLHAMQDDVTALLKASAKQALEMTSARSDIAGLRSDNVEMKSDISELKSDVSGLKADVSELKTDVSELKSDVAEMKSDIASFKAEMVQTKADTNAMRSDMTAMRADIATILKLVAPRAGG
jgi:chromosome segregation ATPase